jgi:hypothetical protein
MKSFAISSLALVALLAASGCAATASEGAESGQNDLTTSATIALKSSSNKNSLQANLYKLIAQGETEATVSLTGAPEQGASARSISCTVSHLVSAVVGQGVTNTSFFGCTFTGFDQVRDGGQLPSVIIAAQGEAPLAGKLVNLMADGVKKGGFGIVKSDGATPPCCDIPTRTTYTMADDDYTLSCTSMTGGFAFMVSDSCTLTKNDSDEVLVQKGTLVHTVGIGGENTGFSVKIDSKTTELVLSAADQKQFVDGRVARVTGTPTTLNGIETHDRPAIKVTNLLVCPAPHTTLSMMPPVTDDAAWMGKNCPDLDIVE